MAAALLAHHAGDRVVVRSAGTAPADTINPAVVEAMAEIGIDLLAARRHPEDSSTTPPSRPPTSSSRWAAATTARSTPASATSTGTLDDPAGQGVDAVRPIRDEIDQLVKRLVVQLLDVS